MIRSLSPLVQWCILIVFSLAFGLLFHHFHIPAALLLGPMIVGITMSLLGSTVMLDLRLFVLAQGILGCMIAQTLTPELLGSLKDYWYFILFVTVSTLCASAAVGWLLMRISSLPGATAAWGTAPGGAAAMVAMSADYGADMRLVAFIQYMRVLLVISTAAIVTHFMTAGQIQELHSEMVWFPALTKYFPITLLIIIGGAWLGRRFAIPSGAMLIPMFIGGGLQATGSVTLELPQWLLSLAYATIGLSVGLRFNIAVLRLAMRALPQIMVSILLLMLFCTGLAWVLHHFAGVDFLVAFLATSPGGVDTVAIMAAGAGLEMPLIVSIQTLRLFSVLLFGPMIARFLSRFAKS